jgi:hypothetical protein
MIESERQRSPCLRQDEIVAKKGRLLGVLVVYIADK